MRSNQTKPAYDSEATKGVPALESDSSTTNVVPVLLDIHQLAKALGVGRTTVENWTRSRRIPSLKIKRVLRYDLQKVLAALTAYERKAISF